MPQKLKLAVAQSRTLASSAETLQSLEDTTRAAARSKVDLVLFPEAFFGGYPRTCNFGSAVGARDPFGREQFLYYFQSAVDFGDTPLGAGNDWIEKKLPIGKGAKYRGDGIREELERVARETGVFIVSGAVERAGGSLYCSVIYVCPRLGAIGKRRKVMPTGTERLIWAQGSPSTLKAVRTEIRGVQLTLAAAICWENFMPLLRQSLYSQDVNLYLAPTADPRDTWLPLMRTIGCEGRCFVLSANQCVTRKNLPWWILGKEENAAPQSKPSSPSAQRPVGRRQSVISKTEDGHEIKWPLSPTTSAVQPNGSAVPDESMLATEPSLSPGKLTDARGERISITETVSEHEIAIPKDSLPTIAGKARPTSVVEDGDEFLSRGGSCIVSPFGEVLAGPLWEVEDGGFLAVEVDIEDCTRGRLDLDVAGSYSRNDAFTLSVAGLDLTPLP